MLGKLLKTKNKLVLFFLFLNLLACSDKKGSFLQVPEGVAAESEQYIVVASGDTNTRSVVSYDLTGQLVAVIKNFLLDVGTVRGLSILGPSEILVALDNTDRLHYLNWNPDDGVVEDEFFTGLGGNVYDVESDSSGNSYVIYSNQIRMYDSNGVQNGNPYINTTLGSCVLSNPRGLHYVSDGRLIVTNQGGSDNINVYDISDPLNATCLSSEAVGNNPYGVVLHSNGTLYFVTQGDDQVYSANVDGSSTTVIFSTNLAVLNNPTAILELPNGNLAVASSGTDRVWEMDVNGTIIGSQPLIIDPTSLNITDMEIMDVSN